MCSIQHIFGVDITSIEDDFSFIRAEGHMRLLAFWALQGTVENKPSRVF